MEREPWVDAAPPPLFTPEEIEHERDKLLERLRDTFPDFETRFAESWEAMDRCFVAQQQFEEYVMEHPNVAKDAETFAFAWRINEMMADLYQRLGAQMP